MQLLHYHLDKGNFGDDLNPWFWDRMLPGWRDVAPDVKLGGIGTILGEGRFPDTAGQHYLILGSGAGYGTPPRIDGQAEWDIRSVRGPRTAKTLGLPAEVGITDPAVMISDFEEFRGLSGTGTVPLFVPHHRSDDRHDWAEIAHAAGAGYCSPSEHYETVIGKIAAAPLVIAESMHAAILADAFRVPWIATSISGYFNAGKWHDWAEGLDIELAITPLFGGIERFAAAFPKRSSGRSSQHSGTSELPLSPPSGTRPPRTISARQRVRLALERVVAARQLRSLMKTEPTLSSDDALARVKMRYLEALDGAKRDYSLA